MFCPKCGNEMEDGDQFCGKCGAKIEDAKIKQKKPASGKTHKKLKIIIPIAGAAVVAAGVLVLLLIVLPNANYDKAMELAQDEQYDEAIEAFEQLNGYKDSEEMMQEMYYEKACKYMDDEQYDKAIDIFEDLDGYSNSEKKLQESKNWIAYKEAVRYYDDGDFEQAETIFVALEDFEDSERYAEDCRIRLDYEEASSLFEAGDYLAAKLLFETITDYEDSESLALVCGCRLSYDEAIEKINEEDYDSALDLLDGIEEDVADSGIDFSMVMDHDEFETTRDDCYKHVCYNYGKELYEQEYFYSAYLEFSKASGLLDADELAQSCVQPFETKEIYSNPDYSENSVSVTIYVPEEVGQNMCVKVYSGMDLVKVALIEAGDKLSIRLPDGPYSFNKGLGDNWYGEKEYFGDEGSYASLIFDEERRLSEELDMMILLFPVYDYTFTLGNMVDDDANESITRDEF